MKSRIKSLVIAVAVAAAALMLSCGDETTQVIGTRTVADLNTSETCTIGDMVVNLADNTVYVCDGDRRWTTMKGDAGEKGDPGEKGAKGDPGNDGKPGEQGASCSATALESGGYVLVCGGEVVGVISNGSSGTPGAQGTSGASCSGRTIDGVGVEISCGGTVIDTLRNGNDGATGAGCSLASINVNGLHGVEITCGAQKDTVMNGEQGVQGIPGLQGETGAAGASCFGVSLGDTAVIISCGDVVVDTLFNGAQGPQGIQGVQGETGQSCTGQVIDGVGIEIACGGVVVDTLRNGNGQGGGTSSVSSSSAGSSSIPNSSSSSSSSSANADLAVNAGADVTSSVDTPIEFLGSVTLARNPLVEFAWDFDGDTTGGVWDTVYARATPRAISHTYTIPYSGPAYFYAKDSEGNIAVASRQVSIAGHGGSHPPQLLVWYAAQRTVTVNDSVLFSIPLVEDANGHADIRQYKWNFGDGSIVVKADSSGLKHAWATAGTYTVTLRVTDSNGDYAEDSITMTILQGAPEVDAGTDVICHNNTACAFSGTASDPNTGSQAGAGSIKKYLWDYEGDGVFDDSSATNSFSHAFADTAATASYTAKFCARDDDNNEICDTTHVSVTNRAPSLTGFVIGKLIAEDIYALYVDSLRFSDADGNLQPVFYWDLDDDGIFETMRRSADTVVLSTNGTIRYIAVYGKDKWGLSSDTVQAMFGRGPQLLDSRDGKTYATVGIGTQTWMAENLNYEYKNGNSVYGNWCYRDSTKYCAQYGRLYSWAAAMDSVTTGCGKDKTCSASAGRVQGVCPDGWHLPSEAEWNTLFATVDGSKTAGTMLKSSTGWENNGNGENAVGFSALPSGIRNNGGGFGDAGNKARFWSASEHAAYYARYMSLSDSNATATLSDQNKRWAHAVRCVQD